MSKSFERALRENQGLGKRAELLRQQVAKLASTFCKVLNSEVIPLGFSVKPSGLERLFLNALGVKGRGAKPQRL